MDFWANEAMAQELSWKEKELRDKFVEEYLIDYNRVAAALRVGFSASFAEMYAERFMQEPYVLKRIKEMETAKRLDDDDEIEVDRRRVRAALLREAHCSGPGSSHSARVSALAKLASILDMDAPTRVKSEISMRGGVMTVPAIADADDWQAAAVASQNALKEDANL